MDIRKIKKLIEMLQDSDLTEIEVQEGEESVRIVRGSAQPFEVKTTSISPASVNVLSENNEVVKNRNNNRKTLFSFCNKYPRPIFWQFLI